MSLIELEEIGRYFNGKEGVRLEALRDVTLAVEEGEFVCITGPSGSGKTTLMNIMGCLDRPSSGSYRLAGREVSKLNLDSLAWLRRKMFGYIFQNFNLLDSATAKENVELPSLYAAMNATRRNQRAQELLANLGLSKRGQHLPSELSGGEQQRVAIARALMNGGHIILADEPTGALDKANGEEVIHTLEELAKLGHTVIIVSHNPDIASRGHRLVELRDGRVINDSGRQETNGNYSAESAAGTSREDRHFASTLHVLRLGWSGLSVALRRGRRLRTVMTLLGTFVGVWLGTMAVVLGDSVYHRTIAQVNTMGLERISVLPLKTASTRQMGFAGLTLDDAKAIQEFAPNVRAVSPTIYVYDVTARRGNISQEVRVNASLDLGKKEGRGNIGYRLEAGEFITADDDDTLRRVAVLGSVARDRLFPAEMDPIGREVFIENTPFRVKGVLKYRKGMLLGAPTEEMLSEMEDRANNWIHVPFKTAYALLARERYLNAISVFVHDPEQLFDTARAIRDLGIRRHGADAFYVEHPGGGILRAQRLRQALQFVLGTIAGIALLVGSLGIMTVMMMSVRARRREIGIRMAVGARKNDILRQFLSEALMYSVSGGLLGALVSLACITALRSLEMPIEYPVFVAIPFGCAILTGLLSGILPARRAASVDPVAALADQ